MHLEVEQKFPVASFVAVRERLATLGVRWMEPIEQVDSYFAHPQRDFARTDEALRIRRVGEQNFVTYKGPKTDSQTKTRRELELPLAGGDSGYAQFGELLEALGFRRVADVRKIRRPGELEWEGERVEIALDEVAEVGTFVELEIAADESRLAAARQAILALGSELGLAEPERRSYLEMLLLGRSI